MVQVGQIVRAHDWPAVQGDRFVVKQIVQQPRSGEVAYLLELDGGTPFRFRAIPTANLVVDEKATRERDRRAAAQEVR